MDDDADILVIGAGAAGLAAARDLSIAGFQVVVLEARDRIGGRIHTCHNDRSLFPIELGAEFIHGRPPATLQIVERSHLVIRQVPNLHWYLRNGILTKSNEYWSKLQDVMEQMKRNGPDDRSFAEFLEAYSQAHNLGEGKSIAKLYVEGFHAAHTERIGVLGLNKVNEAADKIEGDKPFRILSGYDLITQSLYDEAVTHGADIRLNSIVEEVRWQRNRVAVTSNSGVGTRDYRARRLLVTLPLGVLQADAGEVGSVRFVPALGEKEKAAQRLAMGQVIKINLRFRERFWETLKVSTQGGRTTNPGQVAFIHAPNERIPTWWTHLHVSAPVLVGWAGGPRAERLLVEDEQSVINDSIESLAHIFGMQRKDVEELLEEAYTHNWRSDPFSRGAYSYVPVGALEAQTQLAASVDDTLFFAGEAANTEGHSGTVHGAIQSGMQAARGITGDRPLS